MLVSSALELIGEMVYKPSWLITGTDHTKRFENHVKVRIEYPAFQSERADAHAGYPNEMTTYAEFSFDVSKCDDVALYRHILDCIIDIETHEAREFLRIRPTMWAPFHPHRSDGMARYGTPDHDRQFGLA